MAVVESVGGQERLSLDADVVMEVGLNMNNGVCHSGALRALHQL